MKAENSGPIVFEYLDVASYLQDYYKWRKSQNKEFSYEAWSDELQFKSRSYVRMVTFGKSKVSKKFLEVFTLKNFFSKEEEEYFFCLVNYSQARSQKDRKIFGSRLIEVLKSRPGQSAIQPEQDFVSNPQLPRLYTLLGFKDISQTPKNLAQIMSLPQFEVEVFLQTLEAMELVSQTVVDGEVHWKALYERFKVPDDKGNLNLMKFHELSLQDAVKAFSQPKNLRKYKSLLVPLSETELAEFYSLLDDFVSAQVARFSPDEYEDRRLFQMNFNIHSVAESIDKKATL